ncbi:MAG: Uma2 family endonuclease [Cyanobacteria bacterium P01_F01_bin.4]
MTRAISRSLSLAAFLALPETEPASEYINGQIFQKPMPKTRHSRLQGKLSSVINVQAEPLKVAYAFPELRCTFGGQSTVPDIAVLRWEHIEFGETGEPVDDILIAPDWTIEILSPDQRTNRVTGNILHCLKNGCQLGWLLDPDDRSVIVFLPKQEPEFLFGDAVLPVLDGIELSLTVEQVFGWLRME